MVMSYEERVSRWKSDLEVTYEKKEKQMEGRSPVLIEKIGLVFDDQSLI